MSAAIERGITRFDAALGGYGGCPFAPGAAGNISTGELVRHLHAAGHKPGSTRPASPRPSNCGRTTLGPFAAGGRAGRALSTLQQYPPRALTLSGAGPSGPGRSARRHGPGAHPLTHFTHLGDNHVRETNWTYHERCETAAAVAGRHVTPSQVEASVGNRLGTHHPGRLGLKIASLPLPVYLAMAAVVLIAALTGTLPESMVSGFAVTILFGWAADLDRQPVPGGPRLRAADRPVHLRPGPAAVQWGCCRRIWSPWSRPSWTPRASWTSSSWRSSPVPSWACRGRCCSRPDRASAVPLLGCLVATFPHHRR